MCLVVVHDITNHLVEHGEERVEGAETGEVHDVVQLLCVHKGLDYQASGRKMLAQQVCTVRLHLGVAESKIGGEKERREREERKRGEKERREREKRKREEKERREREKRKREEKEKERREREKRKRGEEKERRERKRGGEKERRKEREGDEVFKRGH